MAEGIAQCITTTASRLTWSLVCSMLTAPGQDERCWAGSHLRQAGGVYCINGRATQLRPQHQLASQLAATLPLL